MDINDAKINENVSSINPLSSELKGIEGDYDCETRINLGIVETSSDENENIFQHEAAIDSEAIDSDGNIDVNAIRKAQTAEKDANYDKEAHPILSARTKQRIKRQEIQIKSQQKFKIVSARQMKSKGSNDNFKSGKFTMKDRLSH